jgi:hypothetical protein
MILEVAFVRGVAPLTAAMAHFLQIGECEHDSLMIFRLLTGIMLIFVLTSSQVGF